MDRETAGRRNKTLLPEGTEMTMPKFEPVGYVDYGDRTEWYKRPAPETDLHTADQLTEAYEAGKREQAAQIEVMREALSDIADDYEDRFDMNSQSTNPGMKYVVKQARNAADIPRNQGVVQVAAHVAWD